ncbi:MAG: linear amide C-N hydrolase [Oscillospiraceae bacterium]|uniref:linear amide C-N hydrolase n=1 Tax=Frisingicoccus sp. TaxID=1918627 RepID=UPI002A77FE81|nr:linear amide C-N hydrolase [Frisingicoccus sp.]MDY3080041.1 linear amide C-N hydrolase [Oscillospiraceae bacterium]MDY4833606.1 linear amide C-N hydrolase [Frisingicoccus sp.]
MKKTMKKPLKITLIFLCGILALLLAAVLVFIGSYYTRIRTMGSIEKLTDYPDGYNLYRMDVKYDYSLDDVINYGIKDNQTMIDAILKEALPLLPVKIKAPEFGCTAFTLTDVDGDVHMGRNYDFRNNTSAMLVYCAPKDGYKSVAFAALDNVSANVPDESMKKKLASLTAPFICLDGMNEKGVCIAVLTLDSEPVHHNTGKPIVFTTLAIRLVLDRAATTEEAVELLRGYDMFASSGRDYHFYITDANGDGRVVEYDCESEARELVATPINAVTNFFAIYKEKVLPDQRNGIYGHGRERYDAVLNVFEQQEGNYTNATVWAALRAASQEPDPESVTSNTQWSIDYNNKKFTAEIVIRRNWNDVTRYDLAENKTEATR